MHLKFAPLSENKKILRQCLVGLVVTFNYFLGGAAFSFSATLLTQLKEADSPLQITEDQSTWIASILLLACLPGTIVGSLLVNVFGRKWTYALVLLSISISWAIIATSTTVWQLLLGRSLQGFVKGMGFSVSYCFIGEVVGVKYRSLLLNVINVGAAFGMMFSDLMGTFYSWRISACVFIGMGLLCFCITLYLKNTYVWYLNRGRMQEAKLAYFWYFRDTPENLLEYNLIVSKTGQEISVDKLVKECKKRELLIPLLIMIWFSSTVIFTGGSAISLYSVTIMHSIINIEGYIPTLVIDVIRIIAVLANIWALKYLPIRWIINPSSVFCAIFLLMLCGALNWKDSWVGFKWVALVAMVAFKFFYDFGYIHMYYISLGELLTGITKPVGTTLTVMHQYCMNFIVAQLIPRMFQNFGSVWTFLIFAICNIIGGVGLFFFVPETRNISNEEIREKFRKVGKNKVSTKNQVSRTPGV